MTVFIDQWRRQKSRAFDVIGNSTAKGAIQLELWGRKRQIYRNANLSIYSAQACNAKCPFCVEELRPASRGGDLMAQKSIETSDDIYFYRLEEVLAALRPLDPSVSVTGGEPSKDPRLPRILRTLQKSGARKRTLTSNASGLLDEREGRVLIDWITVTGVKHLNISRAHPDTEQNARLMALSGGLTMNGLREVVMRAARGGTQVRLSCLLLLGEVDSLPKITEYLEFAKSLGVNNVIFRQLMKTDPATTLRNFVVRYSDAKRVPLEPILDELSADPRFQFTQQIMGYYYYVEVWRYREMNVVFEEADLAQLEASKREKSDICHELIFHPNAHLASTWQPWDGILTPA